MNGQKSPKDEMREILSRMMVKNLKKDKTRMKELAAAL